MLINVTALESLLVTPEPDLTNASREDIETHIQKHCATRALVRDGQATVNPHAISPAQITAWLHQHGATGWAVLSDERDPTRLQLVGG